MYVLLTLDLQLFVIICVTQFDPQSKNLTQTFENTKKFAEETGRGRESLSTGNERCLYDENRKTKIDARGRLRSKPRVSHVLIVQNVYPRAVKTTKRDESNKGETRARVTIIYNNTKIKTCRISIAYTWLHTYDALNIIAGSTKAIETRQNKARIQYPEHARACQSARFY